MTEPLYIRALAVLLALTISAAAQAQSQVQSPAPHVPGEFCADLHGASATDYYCTSSLLDARWSRDYGVDHLFSNSNREAWVEGAPGQGIGEWIVIDFKEPRMVSAILIRNGYQKTPKLFARNGRVKRFKVTMSNGESRNVDIRDAMEEQRIPIDPPVRINWIKFVIDDVYPGSAHDDTAITKLWVTSGPVP
jgi:hypothetical protein